MRSAQSLKQKKKHVNPNGFPRHFRQAGMLQSTWPALAMGYQISPGLRNIVSHMPREGCLEMGLKTPSFLCLSHPTVKTIRFENKHSRLSVPKIESPVEPFFSVWLLRWSETCPPSPGNVAEGPPTQKPLDEQKYTPLNSTRFGEKAHLRPKWPSIFLTPSSLSEILGKTEQSTQEQHGWGQQA